MLIPSLLSAETGLLGMMWPRQFSYASLKKESPAYYLCKAAAHLRLACDVPSSCTGTEPMYQATSLVIERSVMICDNFRTQHIEQIIFQGSVALGGAPNNTLPPANFLMHHLGRRALPVTRARLPHICVRLVMLRRLVLGPTQCTKPRALWPREV